MERRTKFVVGEYYHIYSRGVERRTVFESDRDRSHFLTLLFLSNSEERIQLSNLSKEVDVFETKKKETLIDIGSFALLPNHFHLLIREKKENGISIFMQKLLTSYSMFFNIKHQRSGPLFLRPFRSEHADRDVYLKFLFAYINFNPINLVLPKWKEGINKEEFAKVKKFLKEYKYGSYRYIFNSSLKESAILNLKTFPTYFKESFDFEKMMDDYLAFRLLD